MRKVEMTDLKLLELIVSHMLGNWATLSALPRSADAGPSQ